MLAERNSGTSPLKCNIYFWLLYRNLKFIVQHDPLCCEVVKEHITTVIIFSCHNNSSLINDGSLFKVLAFNIALFDLALFDAALFGVELF